MCLTLCQCFVTPFWYWLLSFNISINWLVFSILPSLTQSWLPLYALWLWHISSAKYFLAVTHSVSPPIWLHCLQTPVVFCDQGDYAFEMDAMRNTPCEIHTFDCTYDGQDQGPRHHYHKLCLGDSPSLGMPESAIFKTYTDILAQLDHRHTKIDVLKVDIEGYEFQALAGLLESTPYLPSQVNKVL